MCFAEKRTKLLIFTLEFKLKRSHWKNNDDNNNKHIHTIMRYKNKYDKRPSTIWYVKKAGIIYK